MPPFLVRYITSRSSLVAGQDLVQLIHRIYSYISSSRVGFLQVVVDIDMSPFTSIDLKCNMDVMHSCIYTCGDGLMAKVTVVCNVCKLSL